MLPLAHRSVRALPLIGALLVFGVLARTSPAADPAAADDATEPPREAGAATPEEAEAPPPARKSNARAGGTSTFVEGADALLERERRAVAALRARLEALAAGGEPERRMELQRRIDLLKQETELRIMELQVERLRALGWADRARVLDEELAPLRARVKESRERIGRELDFQEEGQP